MSDDTGTSSGPVPMSTLQEVQTWLGTLTAGDTVSVGSTLFDSAAVTAMYTILPAADDPVSLTITSIDAANATLSGTATILGEDDNTVQLLFTQPASTLMMQVNVTLPSTVEWSLLSSYDAGFGSLAAQFTPGIVGTAYVVNLVFSASVNAGTTLSLPVTLNVATYSGDWLLQGNFTSVGNLAEDALTALAGNNDVLSLLNNYFNLADLSITTFELAFNPTAGTCSMIRIGLSYGTNTWTFFDGQFEVRSINFDVEVFNPFTSNQSFQGILFATMEIPAGGTAFQVGGQFPDKAVFAQLAPGSSLKVSDVFSFFHAGAPSNFPDVEISTLGFFLWPANDNFSFTLAIAQPFPIFGGVDLDNFTFFIGATVDGGTFNATGTLVASFTIGPATLGLNGSYASNAGLSLSGSATGVPLGQIITAISTDFGIDSSTIPAPIGAMELQSLDVALSTGQTDRFTFDLTGTTTIGGVTVTFNPSIAVTWGTSSFTATFGGQVILDVSAAETITFDITFAKAANTGWTLLATYSDSTTGLTFEDIASVFGFALPPIPSGLDLDLTGASFYYDFTTGNLAFGLQSKTYGKAAYVRTSISSAPQNFFFLDCNQDFSLTNLPLVGAELAQIENVQVEDLTVVISSLATVTQPDATAINTVISFLGGGYPLMPAAGINGTFLITANLWIGSGPSTPLSVALGGSTTNTTTTALALATTPGAASSDGVTWFTIQQSFGPVSLQRIGVMFQSTTETLWFEIDATLSFGPLQLVLVGLGIGAPITTFDPQFSLAGLGVSYSNPPLTVAGSLVNLAPAGAPFIEFEGGVTIGTGDFVVQAFGYYGHQNGFNSLFIFGDLAYDFGGPPAFFVTGVALGLGYNSDLNIPTIDQVATFPFVQVLPTSAVPNTGVFGSSPDPQKVLATILQPPPTPPWVVPQAGTLWFAAGITFTSFELVNSQALVIVETGSDLVIALVGTSRAQFPQAVDTSGSQQVYANIELDLLVRFAPSEGVFSLQAVLDPSSFLLTSACVLTGGFAFFVWFGTNPHAGDFVLTLGGYNPGFTPPSYYPTVPAVGFHWSVDSSITVSGGTYFAFTPAVLMLGGELSATYQAGNLMAWFDAQADVLIRWKPFWFTTDIGITLGASYKIDLLFTSVTISAELGCNLALWGPPTGGSVTVDWAIISFTIPFGQPFSSGPAISGWSDVESMLPQTSGSANQASLAAGTTQVLSISPVSGITPSTTTGGPAQAAQWTVRGSQFAFSTSTPIPASTATAGETYSFNGTTFNVYPLAADPSWQNISAKHAVTITANGAGDYSSSFQMVQVQQAVPAALWGSPPENAQGQPQTPDTSSLVVPNQIVGLSASVNPPQIGGSAGPIDVAVNLPGTDLGNGGANLPLSNQAQPSGDVPVNTPSTVATIAGSTGGIAAQKTVAARNGIYAGLQSIGYAPATSNDSMANFSGSAGCTFAAEPLLVS
ncbi:MAG TPA: DUF6603 domain-containing protein [Thermoanaerobaculia bacterium]|nr:DUF6603 domain-containing protein [Thermoanaerobaculia bacterium]